MGLSRLSNLLKSARGTILYVNPGDIDATDSIENQGNSLTRPFKTIQRALIEAARFSYQKGLDNDRFGKTTIMLYPGEHIVDNRPGYIPNGSNNYLLRGGSTTNNLPPFSLTSNFDISTIDNELYKLNSIYGGVILPRGTSLVGMDVRKTKIIPKYVPDPENINIENSAIFRLTGSCYIAGISIFDGNPKGTVYKDYTSNNFIPVFSHHKLSCFEFIDGTNDVEIDDTFLTHSASRTDLDMYYEKIGLVYGTSSGREIEPDYPSSSLDIHPKIDEYRIIGPRSGSIGISSIRSGDGTTPSTTITVTTTSDSDELDVDTPFRIEGITASGYDGQYVVTEKLSSNEFQYTVQNSPTNALPIVSGSLVSLESDTVTSSSPYIFNVELNSVYGLCGLHADGLKSSGFKSVMVNQFNAISLQKDNSAFVAFNSDVPSSGNYDNSNSNNSKSIYKGDYRNYHIKSSNESSIQVDSSSATGFSEQFVTTSGGEISVTNSNSIFGSKSLVSTGFRNNSFAQDNSGYITHIIPPKEISLEEKSVEFLSIDVDKTVSIASSSRLYLYNQTNSSVYPENVIDGYKIGARKDEELKLLVSSSEYTSGITMPGSDLNSEKSFYVDRSVSGINNITNSEITLTSAHTLLNGESIRIYSDTAQLPDGLNPNIVYYAITSGLSTNTNIKIAKTLNDAIDGINLSFNNKGGTLNVVSKVSDKKTGDIGHPVQYDSTNSNWYINVSENDNDIYSTIVSLGSTVLGSSTSRSFISRRSNSNRSSIDTIYRLRYVIPSITGKVARPPIPGYIIQESNTTIGESNSEIETYFGTGSISNIDQQKNFKFISNATWSSSTNLSTISTEVPHDLSVGSEVELVNITSSQNTLGTSKLGYNNSFLVVDIINAKQFTVSLTTDPGTFTNDTSSRTTSLPYFKRKKYKNTYYIHDVEESQRYISGEQDGVYYLTVLNSSYSPASIYFSSEKFSQPESNLFPQIDKDNPESDPKESSCFATSKIIGKVVVDDLENSITKETTNLLLKEINVGLGITNIISSSGIAHTIHTSIDHGLNKITNLSIVSGGAGYGSGTSGAIYNANLIGTGSSVSSSGSNGTAKIVFDGSGTITSIQVMDGGSAYEVGNTLAVTGTATTTGYSEAVVKVDNIYNNVGDNIRISGVSSALYSGYNDLYRVTSINSEKSIVVSSTKTLSNISSGIGATLTNNAQLSVTGKSMLIDTLTYDHVSGIGTVTLTGSHGLNVDQKVRFSGSDQSQYNGDFIVTEILDDLSVPTYSFSANLGVGNTSPSATGIIYAHREGVSSNSGLITKNDESLSGRMVPFYDGESTTLLGAVANTTTQNISINNLSNMNIRIGDYLMIGNEIVRVKTTVSSNPISVFRGVLGSRRSTYSENTTIRKIKINPVEFRRNSIIRSSGHTFEYVGFGPGNYSTSLPENHNRIISDEEKNLAHSTVRNGGINFYSGMDDSGSSISNKNVEIDRDLNNKITEFNGPLVVNDKIISNSAKGIEANSLFLQGSEKVSRKISVGIATPTEAGNSGDIVYNARPDEGTYAGWIYTTENNWKRFGSLSLSNTLDISTFDQIGIGVTTPENELLVVGNGNTSLVVNNSGVGIGTTANQYALNVNGNTNIIGNLSAENLSGDGSLLTNLNLSASGWTNISGNDDLYNTNLSNIGIGTTSPRFNLELGSVGSSTTSLHVNGTSNFIGDITFNNVVGSALTITDGYELNSITSGVIRASSVGIGTTDPLESIQVGSGTTEVFVVSSNGSVGIGTTSPQANLDIDGNVRIKTTSERVSTLSISANIVTIDLSLANNFILDVSSDINEFVIDNIPKESSSFTLRIKQDSTGGRTVAIDVIKDNVGNIIPVYWPGGVVPTITPTANISDIYSFKMFDGENITTSGLYGVIGGQNFS